MKKAIIILAHQLPEQLNIFLEQLLTDPDFDIYIHVNKLCENIIKDIRKDERIKITKNNIEIHWGSDEVLKAILIMYDEVLSSNKNYEYVLINTGQDLLVKKDLDQFLEEHKGRAFVQFRSNDLEKVDCNNRAWLLHKWPKIYRNLYDFKFHPIRILRSLRVRMCRNFDWFAKKKVNIDLKGYIFYYDFMWNALPIEIVRYISTYVKDNPEYMKIYEGAFIPEERFFTTLIMHSIYKDRIEPNSKSLTYCSGNANNHPLVINMQDISGIEESGLFFARKFDIRKDSEVIEYFRKKICE